MREDFVTRLQLQLRDAAEREARAGGFGRIRWRMRRRVGLPVIAGGLAALLAAIAVVAGVLLRRDEPEPSGPQVVARLELTGNPADILPAFGSLWISDSVAGDVVRVDPDTRRVLARIPVGSAQNIATQAVGDELWVRSQRDTVVQRIDPATNAVRARFQPRTPDGRMFASLEMVTAGTNVWAAGDEGALRLDPRTGAGLEVVGPPSRDSQALTIAVGDGHLWMLRTNGEIQRFDATTGASQGTLPPGLGGDFIAAYGRDLIVAAGNTVVRLDGSTGRTLWERSIGERLNAITEGDGLIWVHTTSAAGERDRVTAIAGDSGKTVTSAALDAFASTGMAVVGDELWVDTAAGETLVLRTGQPTR
jgi:PQQ-like domain